MSDELIGSVLFTDLVGFTEFDDVRGDRAAVAVLDTKRRLVDGVLADGAGRVVKELGDGLMVWFRDAAQAVERAMAIGVAVDAARRSGDLPLAVRMGLHHGPVVPRGDDVVGRTVNIAARVADLAGPGELLVTDDLLGAAAVELDGVVPIGAVHVKGVAAPLWLHRVEPAPAVVPVPRTGER